MVNINVGLENSKKEFPYWTSDGDLDFPKRPCEGEKMGLDNNSKVILEDACY